MKTPMQELIKRLQDRYDNLQQMGELVSAMYVQDTIEFAVQMLSKEKRVMCEFSRKVADTVKSTSGWYDDIEDMYNETFNTKEK